MSYYYERATLAEANTWRPTTVLCDRCGVDWGSVYALMRRLSTRAVNVVAVCSWCASEIDNSASPRSVDAPANTVEPHRACPECGKPQARDRDFYCSGHGEPLLGVVRAWNILKQRQ